MMQKRIKAILIPVVILSLFFFVVYFILGQYDSDSEFVIGLLGAIIGGMFTLMSVWLANELQAIKKEYNELPVKIRRISKLRNLIWELKILVSQKGYDEEIIEDILEISSTIDGKTYSKCINIRDRYLDYYYKRFNSQGQDEVGAPVIRPTDEFRKVKEDLFELLITEYKALLDDEEKLTKKYR